MCVCVPMNIQECILALPLQGEGKVLLETEGVSLCLCPVLVRWVGVLNWDHSLPCWIGVMCLSQTANQGQGEDPHNETLPGITLTFGTSN